MVQTTGTDKKMDTLSLELQTREIMTQVIIFGGIVLYSLLVALLIGLGQFLLVAILMGGLLFTLLFFSQAKMAVLILIFVRANLHIVRVQSLAGLGVDGILNLVVVVFGLFYWIMNKDRVKWPKELKFFSIFVLYVVASVVWSVWRMATIRLGLRIVGYPVLLFLVLGEFRTKKDIVFLINVLCLAALPNVAYAIYGFLRNPGIFLQESSRLAGLSYSKPWAVGQYAMALGTLIMWPLVVSNKPNILRWGLLFLLAVVLILTKTRAAVLAFFLSNTPLLFLTPMVSRERKAMALFFFLLVCAVLFPALTDRFTDLFPQQQTATPWHELVPDNSVEWRIGLWKSEIKYMWDFVILGCGYGSIAFYNLFHNMDLQFPITGHGEYLQLFIELGIPGFILYILTMIGFLRLGWNRYRAMDQDKFGQALAGATVAVSMQWMMIAVIDDFLGVFQSITLLIILGGIVANYYTYCYEAPEPASGDSAESREKLPTAASATFPPMRRSFGGSN